MPATPGRICARPAAYRGVPAAYAAILPRPAPKQGNSGEEPERTTTPARWWRHCQWSGGDRDRFAAVNRRAPADCQIMDQPRTRIRVGRKSTIAPTFGPRLRLTHFTPRERRGTPSQSVHTAACGSASARSSVVKQRDVPDGRRVPPQSLHPALRRATPARCPRTPVPREPLAHNVAIAHRPAVHFQTEPPADDEFGVGPENAIHFAVPAPHLVRVDPQAPRVSCTRGAGSSRSSGRGRRRAPAGPPLSAHRPEQPQPLLLDEPMQPLARLFGSGTGRRRRAFAAVAGWRASSHSTAASRERATALPFAGDAVAVSRESTQPPSSPKRGIRICAAMPCNCTSADCDGCARGHLACGGHVPLRGRASGLSTSEVQSHVRTLPARRRGPRHARRTRAVRAAAATATWFPVAHAAVLDATVTRLGEAGYAVKKMDSASPRTATASSHPRPRPDARLGRLPRGRHAQTHRQDVPARILMPGTETFVCVRRDG